MRTLKIMVLRRSKVLRSTDGDHQDFVPELAKLEALFNKQGRVLKIKGQVVDVVREKSVISKNGKPTEVPIEVAVHAPKGFDTKRLTLTFAKTKKWGNILTIT